MIRLQDMRLILLDRNSFMCAEWGRAFADLANVEVVRSELADYLEGHEVECVVSPANSYGLMDGGYDEAISDCLGWGLQKKVQQYIIDHYFGEQPVGSAFILPTGMAGVRLIHAPTMRMPSVIADPQVIYTVTRSTLIVAMQNDVRSILIPAFGGGCGKVPFARIAKEMRSAVNQLLDPPKELNWMYAGRPT